MGVAVAAAISATERVLTVAKWPVGIALTSWEYMWRTTPLHRQELTVPEVGGKRAGGGVRDGLQGLEEGVGPVFHRRYRIRVRDATLAAEELLARVAADPNCVTPALARFRKVTGADGEMVVGDEFVVRMPGPWDGPVRVVDVTPLSFRLATMDGHLEAGEIEFRATAEDGLVCFAIESWARSSSRLVHLLYHYLRMAKEVQFHMWTSFLERVAALSGGRLTGGIDIVTERESLRH